jgi:CubicO group peptidase (beta-lactamase class C family)
LAASDSTQFGIGSLSKLYTVLGVLRLQERGLLDLDAPVQQYLPEFDPPGFGPRDRQVTLRDLITHHAGLPSDWMKGTENQSQPPLEYFLTVLNRTSKALPTGTKHAYSNLAYNLLGLIIQRTSGQRFEDFMQAEVLRPLGIEQGNYITAGPEALPRLAQGHKGRKPHSDPHILGNPAAGLVAHPSELAGMTQMLMHRGWHNGQQFLRPETVAQIFTPQNDTFALDFDFRIGLTWELRDDLYRLRDQPLRIAYHTGTTIVYSNALVMAPGQRLAVILSNNDARVAGSLQDAALDILYLLLEAQTGIPHKPFQTPERISSPSPAALEALPGHWATQWGLGTVTRHKDQLRLRLVGYNFDLLPHSNGYFGLRVRLAGGLVKLQVPAMRGLYLKDTIVGQAHYWMALQGGERSYFAVQITPTPEPQAVTKPWMARLGNYRIRNAGSEPPIFTDVALRMVNGVLCFCFNPKLYQNQPLELPLRIESDRASYLAGLGRWQGMALEVLPDGAILFGGYELEPVR